MKYNIAYSLNHQMTIKADSQEEAEAKLKDYLRDAGVNLKLATLEIWDVVEEEEEE